MTTVKCEIFPMFPADLLWVFEANRSEYEPKGWTDFNPTLRAAVYRWYHRGEREAGWLAVDPVRNLRAGSIFCYEADGDTAQLSVLFVSPAYRRHGLGRRLVETCVDHARAVGYKKIVLWTETSLTDARRLYERCGFTLKVREADHRFGERYGKSETWELDLRPMDKVNRHLLEQAV